MKKLASFLLIASSISVGALLSDEQNNVEIYQRCGPAVVNITATTLRQDFFFDVVPQKGLGSGAIIRPDGYIVTNHHVIGNAVGVEVTLHDKTRYQAKVVGADPDSDLAVLKIEPGSKKLTSIEIGSPESLAVGQKAIAIGNPFGLGGSLTVGVISSLGRDIRGTTERLIKDVIQTDASINPGNSGGPLIDSGGKLIGLNTQIVSQSGGSHGIGFAISAKTIKRNVDQLIRFGKVLRPNLGIEGVSYTPDLLKYLGYSINHGVMLVNIVPGSNAERAGLKRAMHERQIGYYIVPDDGDVIFKIDDVDVTTTQDILDYLGDKKDGDAVTIHFARGKAVKSVTAKLVVQPPSMKRKNSWF